MGRRGEPFAPTKGRVVESTDLSGKVSESLPRSWCPSPTSTSLSVPRSRLEVRYEWGFFSTVGLPDLVRLLVPLSTQDRGKLDSE